MRQMPPRRNCGAAFFLWRTPGAQRSARPPSRRQQCRSAASRTAGTLDRSRQPTGDSRPRPPGKSPGRGHPFLVSAAGGGGKNRIIFRRGVYAAKNPSHAATCKTAPAHEWAGAVLRPSEVRIPLRRPANSRAAQGRGNLKGGRQSPRYCRLKKKPSTRMPSSTTRKAWGSTSWTTWRSSSTSYLERQTQSTWTFSPV